VDKINNIPDIYYKRKSQKYIIRIKTIISETRFTTNSTRTWIASDIELASKILNGIVPEAKRVTKTRWVPDIIFLDCAGIEIINKEIDDNKKIYNTLKSFRDSMIYLVQPYNSYTTNFATEMVNSYYIGKTIYPEQFSDIEVENIAGSIYTTLLGSNIYKQMVSYYRGYSKFTSY
jgi:hypothetical protein